MTQRITFLDYVRVFACFLVMVVHTSENYYGAPGVGEMAGPQSFIANEADRLWVSIYDGFSRMAVPLFMIVSAYLLVPLKPGQTMKQFYISRAKRILPPFIVFMLLYSTLPLLWGQLDVETAMNDLSRLILNFPSLGGHLWFMYPLIALYLIIPIISPWLDKASAAEERFFILLFAISTLMPFLNRWFGEVWGQCFWNEFHALWYFSGFIGYLVIAHYIRKHLTWNRRKRFVWGTILMVVGAVSTMLPFYVQATPGIIHETPMIEIAWTFCTFNCLLATTGTFILFTCIEQKQAPRIITDISKRSYGMYLMHIFWLGVWVILFKQQLNLPTVAAIPCIAIATYITCYVVTKLISLLPGSKYVVG